MSAVTAVFSSLCPLVIRMSQTNWAFYIAMQAGVVPVAESSPGQGKTAVCRAMAAATKRRFLQVILSQKLREDIGGVPVPRTIDIDGEEHECVMSLMPEELVRATNEPSIVLLDELNHASHDVLGAAQEIINNPPDLCWMGAFMNPIEQSTSGVELAPPVINRVCMLQWERHIDERRAGWANGFTHFPAPEFPIVPPDFLLDFGPKWGQLLCMFEESMPQHFDPEETYPKDESAAIRPWRSDRSWTNAGILLAACEAAGGSKATASKLVRGCVGDGPAMEFLAWVDKQRLPTPESILANPTSWQVPRRFDLARAMIAGCIGVAKRENDPETWESLMDLNEHIFSQRRELAVSCHGCGLESQAQRLRASHSSWHLPGDG